MFNPNIMIPGWRPLTWDPLNPNITTPSNPLIRVSWAPGIMLCFLDVHCLDIANPCWGGGCRRGNIPTRIRLWPIFPDSLLCEAAMGVQYGADAPKVLRQYPLSRFGGSPSAAFTEADSDKVTTCPNLQIANTITRDRRGRTAVYLYRFAHLQRQCDMGNYGGGSILSGSVTRKKLWRSGWPCGIWHVGCPEKYPRVRSEIHSDPGARNERTFVWGMLQDPIIDWKHNAGRCIMLPCGTFTWCRRT